MTLKLTIFQVFVDEVFVGENEAEFKIDLAEGTKVLRLKGEYFETIERQIEIIGRGSSQEVRIQADAIVAEVELEAVAAALGQALERLRRSRLPRLLRPAVDVGISVSRVGGAAQIKAMKSVAGTLRLDLAQFRELEAFAKFGSDLDKSTLQQLNRGRIMVEILKQNQYVPMSIANQVAIIYAGTKGFLDEISIENISAYEKGLTEYLAANNQDVLDTISNSGKIDDDTAKALESALDNYTKTFEK